MSHEYLFDIMRCSDGTYSTCTSHGSVAGYNSAWAVTSAESSNGGDGTGPNAPPACFLQIMGSASGIAHVGSTADNLMIQKGEGGSWDHRGMTDVTAKCAHYVHHFSDTVPGTDDDRN